MAMFRTIRRLYLSRVPAGSPKTSNIRLTDRHVSRLLSAKPRGRRPLIPMGASMTYRQLETRGLAAGGILQVAMAELRECEGAGKLGVLVLEAIRDHLAQVDLCTYERRLPNDQRDTVMLISPKTHYGELLLEIRNELRRAA